MARTIDRTPPQAVPSGLAALGWDNLFGRSFAMVDAPGREPGRVVAEHRGAFRVATVNGERSAQLAGRLRYDADGRLDLPVVGDWVALAGPSIVAILDRRTVFVRRDPDPRVGEQLLAANVDIAFLMTSVNRDFNPRRLERYLTMAWSSGAAPVVVLTKTDLTEDLERELARASRAMDHRARAEHRSKWRAIHRAVNEHMDRKYGVDR